MKWFLLSELIGLILIFNAVLYGSGIKESDTIDGPEISAFVFFGLVFLALPWIVYFAGVV